MDETGKPAEDRGAESTLGDLVANALRDGVPAEIATPDIGIVNPGGVRADLLYAGSTATNPANTDGVITYAEANTVLPFVNNVWTIRPPVPSSRRCWSSSGSPPGPSGLPAPGSLRQRRGHPGPTKPVGSRITSVRSTASALEDAKTYKVTTFSFLGTGGDNFTAFKDGPRRTPAWWTGTSG